MAYELRENSGSLFKNDKKESDAHPNATGTVLIAGVEYWVSAWTKRDKNGQPWQALSFKPKDAKTAKPSPQWKGADFNDDIPF